SRGEDRLGFIHRVYTVFNAEQMDGPPPITVKQPTSFEIVEAGEKILKDSGAKIFHDQADRIFYNHHFDTIHLPPRAAFPSAEAYYGTSIHELVHNADTRIMPPCPPVMFIDEPKAGWNAA
ncbi:MAG: hypothetical protein JO033_09520, partial [Acidobacteriaceae bacterium]|nr:hypothetical protein [Acidobacteriaceae bacterium]